MNKIGTVSSANYNSSIPANSAKGNTPYKHRPTPKKFLESLKMKMKANELIKDQIDALSDLHTDGYDKFVSYTTDKNLLEFVEPFRNASSKEITKKIDQLVSKLQP